MGNGDRRHLLNYLDANWTPGSATGSAPSSTTGRWLAAPLALPVGLVAGVADAVVLHPISQVDDAWIDTVDVVWDFRGSTDFRTVLLTPLSAVATPVVFGVTWLWRSVFDIDDSVAEASSVDVVEEPSEPSLEPSSEPSLDSVEEVGK